MPSSRPCRWRRAGFTLLIGGLCWLGVGARRSASASELRTCAAVRGNGARVFVHFASLARFHELYGRLWGISGGSSGSVVALMVDSIYQNPFIQRCGRGRCTAEEAAARIALLLKTFPVHLEALAAEPDAGEFFFPASMGRQIEAERIPQRLSEQPAEGLRAFLRLLRSDRFRQRLNPEILSSVEGSADPAALALDISRGIIGAREFSLDSSRVFLRPGATSFRRFADHYGRLASFYAAEGGIDAARMETLMTSCATPGRGLEWDAVAKLKAGRSSCGELFASLLQDSVRQARESQAATRAEQPIGSGTGLHVLVSVTQMGGDSLVRWQSARQAYLAGRSTEWAPQFRDWSVAYMGRDADLDRLISNPYRFADLKTQRARALKGMSWRDILEHSPAEPGMSRALEILGPAVTTGGWADGQPVQALRNIGCDRVVLFDKTPEQPYQRRVAGLLGASPAELDQLFAAGLPSSSLAIAVANADMVWCSDWDRVRAMDLSGMSAAGWNATLEVRSQDLQPRPGSSRPVTTMRRNSTVCTAPFAS